MSDDYSNYPVPIRPNKNYDYLKRNQNKGLVDDITVVSVNKTEKRSVESTDKYKEKLLLNLRGFKDRLRNVAKVEGKAYHTLATDIIIAEIKRLEKKHKEEDL